MDSCRLIQIDEDIPNYDSDPIQAIEECSDKYSDKQFDDYKELEDPLKAEPSHQISESPRERLGQLHSLQTECAGVEDYCMRMNEDKSTKVGIVGEGSSRSDGFNLASSISKAKGSSNTPQIRKSKVMTSINQESIQSIREFIRKSIESDQLLPMSLGILPPSSTQMHLPITAGGATIGTEVQEEQSTLNNTQLALHQKNSPRKKVILKSGKKKNSRRPPTANEGRRMSQQPMDLPDSECSIGNQKAAIQSSKHLNYVSSSGMHNSIAQDYQSFRFSQQPQTLILAPQKTNSTIQSKTQSQSKDITGLLFTKMFDTVRSNLALKDNPSKQVTKDQFLYSEKYGKDYIQSLRNQVEKSYQANVDALNLKKEARERLCSARIVQIKTRQAQVQNILLSLEKRAAIEQQAIRERHFKKYFGEAWHIVQHWIFSVILDMEKCTRYTLHKQSKAVQHLRDQKTAYCQKKSILTLEKLTSMKQFQWIKFSQALKFKVPKREVQEAVRNRLFDQPNIVIEQVAVVRSKPYIKLQNSDQQTLLKISREEQGFPSLLSIIGRISEIVQSTEDLLHICPTKFVVSKTKQVNYSTLVSSHPLSLFQNARHLNLDKRLFYCQSRNPELALFAKTQASLTKLFAGAHSFEDLVVKQRSLPDSTKSHFKINENSTLKKVKGTNLVRLCLENQAYSILSESTLQDLVSSKVFSKYFESGSETKQLDLDFYVIEEESIFNPTISAIPKKRVFKQVRKLTESEVLILLLFYVKTDSLLQNIEVKVNGDVLKRISLLNDMQSQPEMKSNSDRYFLVDKVHSQTNQLIKQYLLKATINEVIISASTASLCQWPSCLQCVLVGEGLNERAKVPQSPQQILSQQVVSGSSRKRPESGGANRNKTLENKGQRKLTRLLLAFELDLKESPYLRFMKKFKLTKDKSSKSIPQQSFQNIQNISLSSDVTSKNQTNQIKRDPNRLSLCGYHKEIEVNLSTKHSISLQPAGLICNSFYKAQRSFDNWEDQLKNSLCYDILVDSGKGNYLKEIFHKLINFCLNQSKPQPPNIGYVIEVLQQQPQSINILENFFLWINKYIQIQKPIYIKNANFQDATSHFTQQLVSFSSNLRQGIENEKYITSEIRKWMSGNELPRNILRELLPQVVDVISCRDVLIKFGNFQQLIDRISGVRHQFQSSKQGISSHAQLPSSENINTFGLLPRIQDTNPPNFGLLSSQQLSYKTNGSGIVDKLTQIYGVNSKVKPTFQQAIQLPETTAMVKGFESSTKNNPLPEFSQHISKGSASNQSVPRKPSAGSRKDLQQLPVDILAQDSQRQPDVLQTLNRSLVSNQQSFTAQSQANPFFSSSYYKGGAQPDKQSVQGGHPQTPGNNSSQQSSPVAKGYKAPATTTINSAVPFQINPKQRASSAYKSRVNNIDDSSQNSQARIAQLASHSQNPQFDNSTNLQSQYNMFPMPVQNLAQRKPEGASMIANTFQQPPPKIPMNLHQNQQQAIQSIYSNKITHQKLTQPGLIQMQNHSQSRQNRQNDRQQTIVMTYSNAVPRIGSAAEKEKKALGSTFYEKTAKKQKGQSNVGSERKKIKMNNFVKLN